jgi:hypothetical protein
MMKWIWNTAEVKRITGIKPEASSYARLAEVYVIGSEEEEKMAPHLSCEINGVQCKALCDIRARDGNGYPELEYPMGFTR